MSYISLGGFADIYVMNVFMIFTGILKVILKVKCPKERYKWIIIGTNGSVIKKVTDDTSRALNSLLNRPVDVIINPCFDKVLASQQ